MRVCVYTQSISGSPNWSTPTSMAFSRPATLDDAEAVAACWYRNCHGQPGTADGQPGTTDGQPSTADGQPGTAELQAEAVFRERALHACGAELAFVGCDSSSSAVIGFVVIKADPLEVEELLVDADARGLGLASMLLSMAERRLTAIAFASPATERESEPVAMRRVSDADKSARRFYENRGWEYHGGARGSEGRTSSVQLLYEKRLQQSRLDVGGTAVDEQSNLDVGGAAVDESRRLRLVNAIKGRESWDEKRDQVLRLITPDDAAEVDAVSAQPNTRPTSMEP